MAASAFLRFVKNQSGITLVGLLVGLGIASIIFVVLGYINSTFFQNYAGETLETTLLRQQTELYIDVTNPTAWNNTIVGNHAAGITLLDCLANNTCKSGDTGQIALYDAAGHLQADSQTMGFSPSGLRCNNYTAAGSPSCPVQFIVTATIQCNQPLGNLCVAVPNLPFSPLNSYPSVVVKGNLQHGVTVPDNVTRINFDIYNFTQTVVIANKPTSLICATATWDGVTPLSAPNGAVDGSGNQILSPAQAQTIMFNTHAYPYAIGATNYWGVSCTLPFGVSGCAGSMDGGATDPSVLATGNGCFGSQFNWSTGLVISVTCCGSG